MPLPGGPSEKGVAGGAGVSASVLVRRMLPGDVDAVYANECEEYQGTGIGWSKRDFTNSLGAMHVAVCDGQIVAHVSHDGGARRKRFNKEGVFIESILTNKSHRSKGVTAKMLQYFMASSKTVKKVWFELDPKKYSVED